MIVKDIIFRNGTRRDSCCYCHTNQTSHLNTTSREDVRHSKVFGYDIWHIINFQLNLGSLSQMEFMGAIEIMGVARNAFAPRRTDRDMSQEKRIVNKNVFNVCDMSIIICYSDMVLPSTQLCLIATLTEVGLSYVHNSSTCHVPT
jgi:hypothetical protein